MNYAFTSQHHLGSMDNTDNREKLEFYLILIRSKRMQYMKKNLFRFQISEAIFIANLKHYCNLEKHISPIHALNLLNLPEGESAIPGTEMLLL